MNEITAGETIVTSSLIELHLERRLDVLVRGECSEDEFMDELSNLREAVPDSAWDVVALLDQRYRRGQIPVDLFRSIESKIAQRECGMLDDDTTISLHPVHATPRAMTQSIGQTERNCIPTTRGHRNHIQTAASAIQAKSFEAPALRMDDRMAPPSVEIGRVLRNRYVLESRLGSGGMGTVFKAMDRNRCDLPEGRRHVAIKVLHKIIDSRPEVLSNLRREFYCAQAVAHRNIVKVFELDRDEDVAFFTMELLEGELLSSFLERLNPPSISRSYAWKIILEVAAGLAHAHASNVIHADLKPQNIIITNFGEVRILDFGSSREGTGLRSSADGDQCHSTELTPAYACCELLDGQQADPRDDLYALACVSYELLAGEHPFQGRKSTEARDLGLIARRPPGLTRRQWQTLAMGLCWCREDRTISVSDWIGKLKPDQAAAPRLASLIDPKIEPKLKAFSPRTAVLVVALLASLIIWISFSRPTFERKISVNAGGPSTAMYTPANTEHVAWNPIVFAPGNPLTETTSMEATLRGVPSAEKPTQTLRRIPLLGTDRRDTGRSALRDEDRNKISISANVYRIRSREHFAEIHVRRSTESDDDTSFVWWTEPWSAKPGSDYAPQARTTQFVSKGRHMVSLFVRIVPNAYRKHSAVFYVAIGDPGNGATLGRVERTAILLLPSG
jgi:serine/threonine protein kinase